VGLSTLPRYPLHDLQPWTGGTPVTLVDAGACQTNKQTNTLNPWHDWGSSRLPVSSALVLLPLTVLTTVETDASVLGLCGGPRYLYAILGGQRADAVSLVDAGRVTSAVLAA
jgi:hypothetical protein